MGRIGRPLSGGSNKGEEILRDGENNPLFAALVKGLGGFENGFQCKERR